MFSSGSNRRGRLCVCVWGGGGGGAETNMGKTLAQGA